MGNIRQRSNDGVKNTVVEYETLKNTKYAKQSQFENDSDVRN